VSEVQVSGAAAGFEKVVEAFRGNFEEGLELGASFAVVRDGEIFIDLHGGAADKKGENPWAADTLACIYSSGKAVLATLIAREVGAGRLDYDAPVAEVWPEFAENGKSEITLAELMSHQAGLCGLPEEMPPATWLDHDAICERLASMAPLWAPGTANGYHPQTIGHALNEILSRVTGRSVGRILREDFEQADGVEVYCGLSQAEMARAAIMPKPPRAPDLGDLNDFTRLAFLKPWSSPGKVDREDWMAAEIPASNMHATARGLAQIVNGLATGDGIGATAQRAALKSRIVGDDLVLPFHLDWSAGLMRNIAGWFGPETAAFGHAGFGGSAVMIDPARGLSAAYVMNKMSPHLVGDPRPRALFDALYESI
jgi:CubicO group peptidase (beta-lactamase class C family)